MPVMSSTPINDKPAIATSSGLSPVRLQLLLLVCFLVQFIDSYNGAAFFVAIPPISEKLNISTDLSVWLISAYQLTFASFLLGSGRVSDLFGPSRGFIPRH
jgi:MFS family permease